MAYRDHQEPGPRWQHPLGGFSTERNYGHDDLHTPRDYNRGGDYADYGRGGAFGGRSTSGTGAYGTGGSYGDYRNYRRSDERIRDEACDALTHPRSTGLARRHPTRIPSLVKLWRI